MLKYIKEFSNSNKLKAFIETKITDLIKLLENSGKPAIYIGENIYGIYCYLYIIGSSTNLTPSGQRYHNFPLHLTPTVIQNISSQSF